MKTVLSIIAGFLIVSALSAQTSGKPAIPSDVSGKIFSYSFYTRDTFSSGSVKRAQQHYEQAKSLFEQKDYNAALDPIIEAVQAFNGADYYFLLGEILYELGDWKNGAAAYAISGRLGYYRQDYSYYNAACCLSLLMSSETVDAGKIIALLHETFQAGYTHFNYMRKDGDMANAFKLPMIKKVVDEYEELSPPERKLIGVWQDSPMMAAGWGGVFLFYPDKRYEIYAPDGARMKNGESYPRPFRKGTWAVNRKNSGQSVIDLRGEGKEGPGEQALDFQGVSPVCNCAVIMIGDGTLYKFSADPANYPHLGANSF